MRHIGLGFARACAVVVVSMPVPVVWVAAVALGVHWGAGNPWSWLMPLVMVCVGTVALSRPICRMLRFLVTRWTGTVVPSGYRQAVPVTKMSTGFWWNGFTYERTSRDAEMDQSWRLRWTDPATWRDLRFMAVLPFTAGVVAAVPPAGVVVAVAGFTQPGLAGRVAGVLGLVVAVGCAPSRGGSPSRSPYDSCGRRARCAWPGRCGI
ncbi:hypothetical protein OIE66_32430 [Nonomuraea sp. NBC_01738]|uniref:hypothetical protein n=1 Tax=Nonomuraea sp. NBC_01738 TaxID=2976003 RepID=UPI002E1042A5|nr:hypothetical protein OIE66_32430 [Nonomuraea sp. NBC_01738]